MVGATVMPHSVYLHPTMLKDRLVRLIYSNGDTEIVHHRHFYLETADTMTRCSARCL